MNNVDPKALIREVCEEFYDEMEPLNKRIFYVSIAKTFERLVNVCGFLMILYGADKLAHSLMSIIEFIIKFFK